MSISLLLTLNENVSLAFDGSISFDISGSSNTVLFSGLYAFLISSVICVMWPVFVLNNTHLEDAIQIKLLFSSYISKSYMYIVY